MNPRLTPMQIVEIRAAAEHVDLPAEELLDAAAQIRAALLGSGEDAAAVLAHREHGRRDAHDRTELRLRRRRAARSRVALVAAALTLASTLSAALAGALPAPIQDPIAEVAAFFGVDLPQMDSATAVDGHDSTGARKPAGAPNGASGVTVAESTTVTATGPVDAAPAPPSDAEDSGNHYGQIENPGNRFGPDEDAGNHYGQVENPGNHYGNGDSEGPAENPGNHYGNGNGNGPAENPGNHYGNGNGNGPPEDPGNGNEG